MRDDDQKYAPIQLDLSSEWPRTPGDIVVLPQGSSRVVDPDEEVCRTERNIARLYPSPVKVFLLYSRPFENKDEDGIQGLGSIDSLAGTLTLSFTLSPPRPDADHAQPENPKPKGRSRRKKTQSPKAEQGEKQVEIELFQDVTGLRSRKGDTGKRQSCLVVFSPLNYI
jgi:hypothetical protein